MKLIPITDICDFQGGTQPPKNEWSEKPLDGYIRMLQIRDFTQSERTTPEFVKKTKKLKTCTSDDVLIGRYGASIGKILTGLSGAYNVAIIKTIPDESKLAKPFLYYLLKSPSFQNFIENVGARAAQAGFNKTDLTKFKIALVSHDDQIRITHLLGKVEGLIAQRKQHLQQLDELLKSVFLEMFGDPVRNEKEWETAPFNQVGQFKSGGTPSKSRDDFWSGSYPWVSPKDMKVAKIMDSEDHISEKVFDETTLKRIAPNHLLIVVRGMILAHSFPVAINTVDIAINQDMKAIKPQSELNVVYLQHCLISLKRQILKLISTAGHGTKKFDSNAMEKLFIPTPPLGLQNQFSTIAGKIENIKSRYQQSLTDLENLYGALSQKAFKGELDLSRIALPLNTEAVEVQNTPKPFNQGFARQLLAAEILHRHHQHKMTQMKLQKLIHLAEHHAQLDEIHGDYQRQAAGPYDNRIMYGINSGLEKQQWFKTVGHGRNATYSPLVKTGNHKKYLAHWQDRTQKIDELLTLLGKAKPEQCEIVATLYATWNDLLIDNEQITDERIIAEASSPERWHQEKAKIEADKWPKALQWMRDNNLVPTGYGKHTRKLQ